MENRRVFLKKMATGALIANGMPTLLLSHNKTIKQAETSISPSSTINFALIGKGKMGTSNVRTALSVGGIRIRGACDLYDKRLEDAKKEWGNDIYTTKDYKEILSRQDIDAVIIATPDHWHQPIAIEALNAGKHVYCEKPVIHKLEEGEALLEAQRKNGALFQVGSQGMASIGNRAARLLIKAGLIGPVNFIDGQFTAAPRPLRSYTPPDDASEKTIWWERFIGSAPKHPFDPQRFFSWRSWRDYGTGVAGDLFVHVLASIHYIMEAIGPDKVYTTGGIRHYTNGSRDTPDIMLGYFDYPDRNNLGAFTVQLGANYVDGISKRWGSTDFRIVGSRGSLDVGWDKVTLKTTYDIDPKDVQVLDQLDYGFSTPEIKSLREYIFKTVKSYKGGHYDHHSFFINGIRNNEPVTGDALFAVRSSAPVLLSYESYLTQQAIKWDAQNLKIKV